MILKDGFKAKDLDGQHDVLSHGVSFTDPNYTLNRVVTDLDWSPQISELLLASYSENEEGSIKDHVGVALLWNPQLRTRPEFYCFCQSAVTSVKFYPFSNNTVIGGCYNGQLLMWDIRSKSMPVQRSGISADAHKYPVNSLDMIGTQIANNVASFSTDGMQCIWDVKQLSRPIRTNKVSGVRPARTTKPAASSTINTAALNRSSRLHEISSSVNNSAIERQREQIHEINVTACAFPKGDANNYYIGSLNGAMYKNALHNRTTENIIMYDDHNGPVSALSVNHSPEYDFLNGLVLTSSFDWTVKLWNPAQSNKCCKTFESSEDFIYDVKWNPVNPTLFATANNDGYVDVFDLTKDSELPVSHKKVNNYAQNKLAWNHDGTCLVTGDSSGNVHLYGLSDKYRKNMIVDPTKAEGLKGLIARGKED